MKTVAVLMSGGVDSSVAALLLKKKYKVLGVTLDLFESEKFQKNISDAQEVAKRIGIEHVTLNIRQDFEEEIISYFCNSYIDNNTPNPCVVCNAKIKFGGVYKKLLNLFNIDYIGSGHYATVKPVNKGYAIASAYDLHKDQSYFLCRVEPRIIKYMLFPLSNLTKEEVRSLAKDNNLNVSNKKDSFEICFIEKKDYRSFLLSRGYEVYKKGSILDSNSKKFLGYHKGYMNYTIGQKSGFNIIQSNEKMYVIKKDKQANTIYLGKEEDILTDEIVAADIIVYDNEIFNKRCNYFARIRYKSMLSKCNLIFKKDHFFVRFEEKQKMTAPGQFVAVYDQEKRIVLSGKVCDIN